MWRLHCDHDMQAKTEASEIGVDFDKLGRQVKLAVT
jgi:hypothetical protein